MVYHRRCTKQLNDPEQTAIWSDESVGLVVGGAMVGQPEVVSSAINGMELADHNGEIRAIAIW